MSKGLEALKDFKEDYCAICIGNCKKCELTIIEKELKALDIIKNKGVDILALQHYKNANEYNFSLRGMFSQLTEEEFNLLKEVLL